MKGRLSTKLYDKRDDINFPIVDFPFMRSTIPAAHVTLSMHKQYLEITGAYQNSRSKLRTCKHLNVFFIT
jgi:hypothetical protein